ncbi:Glycine--tRNA [Nucleospora cyclopteri]
MPSLNNSKSLKSKKEKVDQLLKHRFFVDQVIYPPQNGFLNYGPTIVQTKHEMLKAWRKIMTDENMLEIEPSIVLPYDVLKNSGHIDKFCDVVVTDENNVVYRADHLIEEKIGEYHKIPINYREDSEKFLEKLGEIKKQILNKETNFLEKIKNLRISINKFQQFDERIVEEITSGFECENKHLSNCNKEEIDFIIEANNLTAENSNFSKAKDYNLIFKLNNTQYLRPELAQSQFTSFRRAYDFNNGQMPFATFSIGKSYRNEISARGGMFRTKEFEQAEIEYFTEDGNHEGFEKIRNISVLILPNSVQAAFSITLGDAFDQKIISSQAICYFIAKAQQFLLEIGIKLETICYRQHNVCEMAHYANDCWDVEILTLSGWIECAGIADRSTYDLNCHSSSVNPYVKKQIKPRISTFLEIDKKTVATKLKQKYQEFEEKVKMISENEILSKKDGEFYSFSFEGENYNLKVCQKTVEFTEYIPRVIEPSFGTSRILYALVEQGFNFTEERNVLSLKPKMCFKHVAVTSLRQSSKFTVFFDQLKGDFNRLEIRFMTNTRSVSIGKRYFSCDEIGIPFFVTLDEETVQKGTVTIRERDSMQQISISINQVAQTIKSLIDEKIKWEDLFNEKGI